MEPMLSQRDGDRRHVDGLVEDEQGRPDPWLPAVGRAGALGAVAGYDEPG
jgi:hypothetical protein